MGNTNENLHFEVVLEAGEVEAKKCHFCKSTKRMIDVYYDDRDVVEGRRSIQATVCCLSCMARGPLVLDEMKNLSVVDIMSEAVSRWNRDKERVWYGRGVAKALQRAINKHENKTDLEVRLWYECEEARSSGRDL